MVGGKAKDVVSDLSTIEVAANELALPLNSKNSEVISYGRNTLDLITSKVPDIKNHPPRSSDITRLASRQPG